MILIILIGRLLELILKKFFNVYVFEKQVIVQLSNKEIKLIFCVLKVIGGCE